MYTCIALIIHSVVYQLYNYSEYSSLIDSACNFHLRHEYDIKLFEIKCNNFVWRLLFVFVHQKWNNYLITVHAFRALNHC